MAESKVNKYIYTILHKHILIMLFLSLGPGIFYVILGWIHNNILPAFLWYLVLLLISGWGYYLYKTFDYSTLGDSQLHRWKNKITIFFYMIFSLWAVIFILYADEVESKMHYIAIFTELGALVVATTLLFADKYTLRPILIILTLPLTIYFIFIGEFYGYVLALFSVIFSSVLYYSSKSSERLLEFTNYQADHDQLTNLFNRRAFVDLLQRTTNELSTKEEFSYILLIDLDHFKSVNDSFGHNIGDELLKEVAQRLRKVAAHNQNVISRIGGDEFIYLGNTFSTQKDSLESAKYTAQKLLKILKETYTIKSNQVYISASIGISLLNQNSIDPQTFIHEADVAMYEVKARGRDGAITFDNDLSTRLSKHLAIEQRLHFSVQNKEIYLHYQPQLDCHNNIIGCEVLVRWHNKDLGTIPPDKFIPIAEQTGYMITLGEYILEESLKTLVDWHQKGIYLKKFSINISARQLFDYNFIDTTVDICQQYLNVELSSLIVFEITETHLIDDIKKVLFIMNTLKERLGVRFSLDDFGTGYSSLNYLQKLPLNELKIDKSFVKNIEKNDNNQKILHVIYSMADIFNLQIVAEGVEQEENLSYLIQHSSITLQGYLFSKPLPKDEFENFYYTNQKKS